MHLMASRASVTTTTFLVLLVAHNAASATEPAAPPPTTTTTVPLDVGVILDLATVLGKKSLLSMEMAVHDFYVAHPKYSTRVKLHVRDSNRDVVAATSAAIDLINNKRVGVIIGPQNTLQAEFLTYLANKTKIPIITSSATGDTITQYNVPYFLRACVKGSFQAAPIATFVKSYGWTNVVLIYEDNNYGVGILPSITDALEAVDVHVIHRSAIHTSFPDERIDVELYKLMTMQTRVFIVHMLPADASRLFARASSIGMLTEGYVWIVTDDLGIALDVLPQHTAETMLGVVGFRPYVAKSTRITDFMDQFVTRYRAKYHQDSDIRVAKPNMFQYWAYDVVWAIAYAIEKSKMSQSTTGYIGKLVDDLKPFPAGTELLSSIMGRKFDGLAGKYRFVDRHLPIPPYEIVNVIEDKIRRIGFWSPGYGLSTFLNSSTREGQARHRAKAGHVLKAAIWPGDSIIVPRGWEFPVNGKILQIGVPVRRDFKYFVNVEDPNSSIQNVTGYCIDVFEAAVKKLPYALRFKYIPYDCANSYDSLVAQVYFKTYDGAVGDLTIVSNRTGYVDFTVPYKESGVSMLVLARKDEDEATKWIFLKPLTNDLWIVMLFFVVLTGLVVCMIEKPIDDQVKGSKWEKINTYFYFAFSTGTSMHDQKLKSIQSKVIVVSWCFVMLVIVQSYTASLSSMLTAKRLQPSVIDPIQLLHNDHYVGYQNGSFVHSMLRRLHFKEHQIKAFSTQDEYAYALKKGSKEGGVSAIFDETPYINSFLHLRGKDFQKVGPIDRTVGFGFAFPKGSPLVEDLSNAILNLIEGSEGSNIERKWFGDQIQSLDYDIPDTSFSRLSSRSFEGLFIINGSILGLMVLINLLRYAYEKHTAKRNTASTIEGEAQPSPNDDAIPTIESP